MCAYVGVALTPTSASAQSAFEVGPYLNQLTCCSVVVRVETDDSQRLSLELGARKVEEKAPSSGVHSLTIDGLKPKTTLQYTLKSSAGASASGSFSTAPADDDPSAIRFILFGDDRGNAAIHKSIVERMRDEPADFLVNTGDLVADGRVPQQWQSFFDIEGAMLRERCLFPTIGNHDLEEESGATFLRYFGSGDEQSKHVFNTTFRWGLARFFMLNGEESFTGDDRAWLEEQLAKAEGEPGLVWRVAVVHDGPFASGLHGDNDRLLAAKLPEMLHRHHVDFVLEGHDHIYERGVAEGLRYVVSGGAGAPLYPMKHLRASARKVESSYHYVLFDLEADHGKLVAKRVDGSLIESVGFSKASFWDDDLPNAPGITPPVGDGGAVVPATSAPAPDEKKESSNEVPYAAAGVLLVGGVWFWFTRRKKKEK